MATKRKAEMIKVEIRVFAGDYDKEEFYRLMGEMFASREVRRELPYLVNEPGREWYVATQEPFVLGFGAVTEHKTSVALGSAYVLPNFRNRGIYSQIVEARLSRAAQTGKPITVACQGDRVASVYQRRGFAEVRRTKQYVFMRREPS